MRYTLKPLHCRPWMLQGLSPKLIESHYENHYGGALKRLNAIAAQLEAADFPKMPGFALNVPRERRLMNQYAADHSQNVAGCVSSD